MSYRLGVDVGGTFTDLLLIDGGAGQISALSQTLEEADARLFNSSERCLRAGRQPSR